MNYIAVAIVAFLAADVRLLSQEYEITLESNGDEIAVIGLSISDGMATTKVGDVVERFDLKGHRWEHEESREWVKLAQCETWATQSKEKTSKSAVSVPEKVRQFVLWSLNPTFRITETDTTLMFKSGQVDYKITGAKTDDDLSQFFLYSRLNAYKKAMTERKLPPFAELKVLEELERRKWMPSTMEIQIPGVPGSPTITVRYAALEK